MFKKIQLLFNTIKYLKFQQILNRIKRNLFKPKVIFITSLKNPYNFNIKYFIQCSQSMFGEKSFKFLNKNFILKNPHDWNKSNQDKLWLYNLHYFDDLNAIGSEQRAIWHDGLIKNWIDDNPIGFGIGWEPYTSSLRIVNWIKWSLQGGDLKQEYCNSLSTQVSFLNNNLEYHLLGNHLFSNAKALIFAGLYFQGPESEKWYKTGLKIFNKELQEQVLLDGGNFELSPMYHAIFLEDLLDIVNIHQAFDIQLRTDPKDAIISMFHWLRVMSHPDGEVSFFNDSTIGISPNLNELERYAERLNISLTNKLERVIHLEDSGYIMVKDGGLFALLDVARVGPDYIPGHAHADTLSFELSLFGERVIVNSGISCYGDSAERIRQRGTKAHSTVVINGENSSEVWSSFRVARRATPFNLKISKSKHRVKVSCSHDGYKRLKGKPVHTRKWVSEANQFLIHDSISGSIDSAEARYHFHPNIKVELDAFEKNGSVVLSDKRKIHFEVRDGKASIVKTTHHPEFGLSIDSKSLVVNFISAKSSIKFYW